MTFMKITNFILTIDFIKSYQSLFDKLIALIMSHIKTRLRKYIDF